MAGIGQRYTSDNVPWSASQNSFGMGRTFAESNKQFPSFMPPDKRPFTSGGSSNASALNDLSMLNGDMGSGRNASYLLDGSSTENGGSLLSSFTSKRPQMGESAMYFGGSASQIKSLSSLSRFPTNGTSTLLDPSEFPPIQQSGSKVNSQSGPTQPQQSANSSQALRSFLFSQPNSSSQQPSQQFKVDTNVSEFSIDADFPALPGSQASSQPTSRSQPHTPQPNLLMSNGIVPSSTGCSTPSSTAVPKNMISDQFGMLGLLKLVHVGDLDNTHHLLAPGIDLLSLSINSQTPGEWYPTFLSPCHDSCMGRPQDLDYPVPQEYLIRHAIGDSLLDPPMGKLNETTLFWLFHNCCQEEVQLVAAKELSNQKWMFHKKEGVWFLPNLQHGMGPCLTTYWDPKTAQRAQKEMTVNYNTDVDDSPSHYRTTSGLLSASISYMNSAGAALQPGFKPQLKSQSSVPAGMFMLNQQQKSMGHLLLGNGGSNGLDSMLLKADGKQG